MSVSDEEDLCIFFCLNEILIYSSLQTQRWRHSCPGGFPRDKNVKELGEDCKSTKYKLVR